MTTGQGEGKLNLWGFMKDYSYGGGGEFVGIVGIGLSFLSDSFFIFLPHSLVVFFLSVEADKELKTRGKIQGHLYTQTLFWDFTTILWLGMLPEPVQIVTFLPDKVLKYSHLQQLQVGGSVVYSDQYV